MKTLRLCSILLVMLSCVALNAQRITEVTLNDERPASTEDRTSRADDDTVINDSAHSDSPGFESVLRIWNLTQAAVTLWVNSSADGHRVRLNPGDGKGYNTSDRSALYIRVENPGADARSFPVTGSFEVYWNAQNGRLSLRRCAVIVYDGMNFDGAQQGFGIGSFRADLGQMNGIGNDTISSLRVEPGFRVRLCEHEGNGNGDGECSEFGSGSYVLAGGSQNDNVSFINALPLQR